jgi:hypothetical protein
VAPSPAILPSLAAARLPAPGALGCACKILEGSNNNMVFFEAQQQYSWISVLRCTHAQNTAAFFFAASAALIKPANQRQCANGRRPAVCCENFESAWYLATK